MAAEANRVFPFETGGVLMGYWVDPGGEVVITHATGPGPRAVHGLYSFNPDADYQEEEIARHYEASGRLHSYLGDWHTHPRESAYLSRRDRRTLRKIATCPEARAPIPIMAVLGAGKPEWLLGIWKYSPTRLGRIILRNGVISLRSHAFAQSVVS